MDSENGGTFATDAHEIELAKGLSVVSELL